ncbi:MAG: NAD-dependent epimerase/dehydratase family protein, partial [bacterium]
MILVTGATGFIGRSLTNRLELSGVAWRPFQGRVNSTVDLRAELDGIETI